MAKAALTPEETKLKELLLGIALVSQEDLDRAEADVLLVRRYGGKIDLKLRLVDLGLVQDRQVDAIERGLGMKKTAPPAEKVEAEPHANAPEEQAVEAGAAEDAANARAFRDDPHRARSRYFDVSRLTGPRASADAKAAGLDHLRLDAKAAEAKPAAPPQAPPRARILPPVAQTASSAAPKPAPPSHPVEDAPGKGGFVPSWKREIQEQEPMPEPGPQKRNEPEPKSEPAPGGLQTVEDQEQRLKHIIRHVIKTRTHEVILDHLIKNRMSVVEPAEVAHSLALKERQVRQVLDDLRHAGIIKDIGTHPYALSPGKKDLDDLKFFFRMWGDSQWHGKMLTWLLAQEKA